MSLKSFANLLSKAKEEEGDVFEDIINKETEFITTAVGDTNMRKLQKGEIIQLERKGYYIVDTPFLNNGRSIVLFNIPSGKK